MRQRLTELGARASSGAVVGLFSAAMLCSRFQVTSPAICVILFTVGSLVGGIAALVAATCEKP